MNQNNCTYDPRELKGKPIGMLHCPDCGEMVLAGAEHPKAANTHGGKRKSAGRPPSKNKKIRRNLSFKPETWIKLGRESARLNMTRSEFVSMLIGE